MTDPRPPIASQEQFDQFAGTRVGRDHRGDGNAVLGIAIGLALTAILAGFVWAVLGPGAWHVIGIGMIVASGSFLLNVWDGAGR